MNTECMEKLLDCTNDDCKMQVPRKNYDAHVKNECDCRVVSCPFAIYGCTIRQIKARDLNQHKQEFQMDHLVKQFTHVTNEVKK